MSLEPSFANRVVLVTGGAQGIGRGIVEAFARAGRLAAGPRAALMMAHATADGDGDGTASAAELRRMAEAEAAGAADGADAQMTSVLMAFDADGDGRLAVAEVAATHAALIAANG